MVWPHNYPPHNFSGDHTETGGDDDICFAVLQTAVHDEDGFEMIIQCGLSRAAHSGEDYAPPDDGIWKKQLKQKKPTQKRG